MATIKTTMGTTLEAGADTDAKGLEADPSKTLALENVWRITTSSVSLHKTICFKY